MSANRPDRIHPSTRRYNTVPSHRRSSTLALMELEARACPGPIDGTNFVRARAKRSQASPSRRETEVVGSSHQNRDRMVPRVPVQFTATFGTGCSVQVSAACSPTNLNCLLVYAQLGESKKRSVWCGRSEGVASASSVRQRLQFHLVRRRNATLKRELALWLGAFSFWSRSLIGPPPSRRRPPGLPFLPH
jgi:hypothetical protein